MGTITVSRTANIRNIARIVGVRPAQLGDISLEFGVAENATTVVLTVPVGYLYLLWNYSLECDPAAAVTGYGYGVIDNGAATVWHFGITRYANERTGKQRSRAFTNPIPLNAGLRIAIVSSVAYLNVYFSGMIEKIPTGRLP